MHSFLMYNRIMALQRRETPPCLTRNRDTSRILPVSNKKSITKTMEATYIDTRRVRSHLRQYRSHHLFSALENWQEALRSIRCPSSHVKCHSLFATRTIRTLRCQDSRTLLQCCAIAQKQIPSR